MTATKCTWSLLVPWHNDFLTIWLYISFALYFWIEAKFIRSRNHVYHFKFKPNFDFMFLATLGMAISLTCTAIFLIFYPISAKVNEAMNGVNFAGQLVLVYLFTFAFVSSELFESKLYFPVAASCIFFLAIALTAANFGDHK